MATGGCHRGTRTQPTHYGRKVPSRRRAGLQVPVNNAFVGCFQDAEAARSQSPIADELRHSAGGSRGAPEHYPGSQLANAVATRRTSQMVLEAPELDDLRGGLPNSASQVRKSPVFIHGGRCDLKVSIRGARAPNRDTGAVTRRGAHSTTSRDLGNSSAPRFGFRFSQQQYELIGQLTVTLSLPLIADGRRHPCAAHVGAAAWARARQPSRSSRAASPPT